MNKCEFMDKYTIAKNLSPTAGDNGVAVHFFYLRLNVMAGLKRKRADDAGPRKVSYLSIDYDLLIIRRPRNW